MKKFLAALALTIFAALPAQAQRNQHVSGGVRIASAYNTWQATVEGGTYTGTVSVIVYPAIVTLSDGYSFNPFSTSNPILIGVGSNQQSLTPSAASSGNCPTGFGGPQPCETLTLALGSDTYGQGDPIVSGSGGIDEAALDAANYGGGSVFFDIDCGVITLSTSGATTTSNCTNIPKTFTNLGASVYVTTTITTSASYSIGIASSTTAWVNACTSLTAGTTCSQFVGAPAKTATGTGVTALLVTANATAGAGAVHVKVWGYIGAQSNF